MKKVARMLRAHRPLLLNWSRARKTISSGVIEDLNNKLKLTTRNSYGFRTFRAAEIALYHTLGVTKTIVFAYREILKTMGFQKRPILTMFFVAM
jgi:hypothetical protein